MSEEQETYQLSVLEKREIAMIENSITLAFNWLNKLKCPPTVTMTGLTLDPDATFHEARKLLAGLVRGTIGDQVISTMRNFYIGDVLNQGGDIYGEEWSQVLGTDTGHLEPSTISNLQWCARSIAPDIRRPMVMWTVHMACASLDREKQEYYLDYAERERKEDASGYRQRVLDAINRDKIAEVVNRYEGDKREKLLDVVEKHSPSWAQLDKMAKGEIPYPLEKVPAAKFVAERAKALVNMGCTGCSYEDLMDAIMEIVEACKSGAVE